MPSIKLLGKDRVAVIAKQLNEYLHLYMRETELFYSDLCGSMPVAEVLFQSFLHVATENDLEEILTLHMRLYKCAHVFLGRCSPPPPSLKPHGLLQSLPQLCSLAPSKVTFCFLFVFAYLKRLLIRPGYLLRLTTVAIGKLLQSHCRELLVRERANPISGPTANNRDNENNR